MREAHRYVSYVLLTFLERGSLSDAILPPKSYSLWNRDPDQPMNMNASRPQIIANSTSEYPESHFNVSKECILWDKTCQGDKQKAGAIFFGKTLEALLENECFTGTDSTSNVYVGLNQVLGEAPAPFDSAQCPGGLAGVPPATSALWSTLKSWMREPACASYSLEYSTAVSRPQAQADINGCCGACLIGGPNVDVYYWPTPYANTSCLSIIGTSVNPPTQGATTDDYTYWGYTPTDAALTNSVVTTMVYTSINGIYFKIPMVNPWETNSVVSISPDVRVQARANPHAIPIQHRAPINESNGSPIGNQSSPRSIVTYSGHIFTSPSIYVNFYSLTATDSCGYLGPIVSSTLLAFAPGELSTVATAMYAEQTGAPVVASVYNFDDLPCPPMSVMWDQWYKPEPGEPYRPLIVFPSKVLDIDPAWKTCAPGTFTGYDPPRTLDPAAALIPSMTPLSIHSSDSGAAKPAATQKSLPKMTSTPVDPAKTSEDFSFENSLDSSGLEADPPPTSNTPESTKSAPIDPSSNEQGINDPQKQSLEEDPASADPDNSSVRSRPSKIAANRIPNQQDDNNFAHKKVPVGDGETPNQSRPLPSPILTTITTILGGHSILASSGGYNIDGVDLKPGASITGASGQQIVLDPSNNIYIGGQTAHIDLAAPPVITTIANHAIKPISKAIVAQGHTLSQGGPAAIIASTTISLDTSNNIFVNGHSYSIPTITPTSTTVNGEAITPLTSGISIGSTILTPGAPALIISGTLYSLDSSSNLHYGESSFALPVLPTVAASTQIMTLAGQPVVRLANGISIAGTTLTAGAPAISGPSGMFISLGSSDLVLGSSTIPLETIPSSGSPGGSISSGLGNHGSRVEGGLGSNGSMLPFTGGSKGRGVKLASLLPLLIAIWVVVAL